MFAKIKHLSVQQSVTISKQKGFIFSSFKFANPSNPPQKRSDKFKRNPSWRHRVVECFDSFTESNIGILALDRTQEHPPVRRNDNNNACKVNGHCRSQLNHYHLLVAHVDTPAPQHQSNMKLTIPMADHDSPKFHSRTVAATTLALVVKGVKCAGK